MAELSLALAAAGLHEDAFVAWGRRVAGAENTILLSDTAELLARLEAVCEGGRNCIGKLYIFSHGGIYGGDERFEVLGGDNAARLFLRDLYALIRAGKISFCPGGLITMTGCRVAATDFPALLATLTGCVVRAPRGMAYPKPGGAGSPFPSKRPGDETGEWLSGDGHRIPEEEKSGYLGWVEYTGDDPNGRHIGEQLGEPVNACLLRIW